VPDNENVDYRLVIRVDHPEYDNVPALPVHILRLPDGGWVVDRSSVQFWDFDCGKDEAPLAIRADETVCVKTFSTPARRPPTERRKAKNGDGLCRKCS